MKALFDKTSYKISELVTKKYSTSFSIGIKLISGKIRKSIYAIYGFVRYADEIVDSFHGYDQERLLNKFIADYHESLEDKISLNPILNAFQEIVLKYELQEDVEAFLTSMCMDLDKKAYATPEEYKQYIYGSADVVGLMCLKVFVDGNESEFEKLKPHAMSLGSAFQKVNFLRDVNADFQLLGRSYFPNLTSDQINEEDKAEIIADIRNDFNDALVGIKMLPLNCRLGVYVAYKYYLALLNKIEIISAAQLMKKRIRIPNYLKGFLFCKAYVRYKLNYL